MSDKAADPVAEYTSGTEKMTTLTLLRNLSELWRKRLIVIGLLCVGLILMSGVSVSGREILTGAEKLIFDFSDPNGAENWLIVNDGVMGGVSQSQLVFTSNGTALFRGSVSLDNYGGFASVRSYPADYQLASYEGLILRVKGDGQQYKLRLRTDNYMDGITYQATFQTEPDKWLEIRVPFHQTVPVFRGYIIADAPQLDSAKVVQIGFMISDKQAGPFALEIDSIKAYRHSVRTPSFNQAWRGAIPW